ncbi:MAG: hypothetical protein ACE37F_06320 [Nannocystaceae bacterium]|nr:hypothetical protein [bacterium]
MEPERRPLAEADPLLAEYAAALRSTETPSLERSAAVLASLETRAPRRLWIPLALAVAAVLAALVVARPSAMFDEGESDTPTQTPYRSDAAAAEQRARGEQPPTRKAQPSAPPQQQAAPEVPVELPVSAPEVEVEVVPDPDPTATPARRPSARQPAARGAEEPEQPGPSSLARETALLREIKRAQADGKHTRVLQLTADHAQRFPGGTFSAERSLARVRALCQVGRAAQARSISARFVRNHPKSHLLKQFTLACPE